jgi:branched-chain amino acid transport system substrate-binding protein
MKVNRLTAVIVTVLVCLAMASCKSSSSGSTSSGAGVGNKTSLTIGFPVSLTGANADSGKLMRDAYQFWADTVNAKGGLKVGNQSLKINLKYYDDESNANTSATIMQKLISEDKVDFLLGPYASANNLTASTVAEKNHYVMMDTEGASNDIFNKGYKYTVGNPALATDIPKPALDYLSTLNPKPKLAVFWADDAYSKVVGQAMVDQAKAQGFEVVVAQQYTTGLKDFSTLITQAKAANADVVFGAGHQDEAIQIVKQEQQLDYHPSATIQTVGPSQPGFFDALGPAAESQFGTIGWAPTIKNFKDDLFGDSPTFAANFKKAMGYDPEYHVAQSAAGAELLGLAIQKANSLDQDKVLDALRGIDMMTVDGPFKVRPDGSNASVQELLGQDMSGTMVAVFPNNFASAKPKYPAK